MPMVTPDAALMPLSIALCHADWRSGIPTGRRNSTKRHTSSLCYFFATRSQWRHKTGQNVKGSCQQGTLNFWGCLHGGYLQIPGYTVY